MFFKRIHEIWAKVVRLRRIVFSWAKAALAVFQSLSRRFRHRRKFRRLYLKGLIYLYVVFVLAAPFSQAKLVHAPILPPKVEAQVDSRIVRLGSYLKEYNSPLAPYAAKFVNSADKYGVDWRLLVAISGNESGFGRVYVRGSHNAYGWGGGYIYFKSWEEGIETINRKIYEDYYKRGKSPLTLEQFGKIYSGQPSWPQWVGKIRRFMNQISAHQLAANK